MFVLNNHEIGRCQELHCHDLKEVMEIEFPVIRCKGITTGKVIDLESLQESFYLVAKLLHIQEMNIKWTC